MDKSKIATLRMEKNESEKYCWQRFHKIYWLIGWGYNEIKYKGVSQVSISGD